MNYILFTDGACRGNPGPGGWAYLLADRSFVWEACGSAQNTTNNRMELQAFLEALKKLEHMGAKGVVKAYLDSQYVLSGAISWRFSWRSRDWITKSGEPVRNRDLWEKIDALMDVLKLPLKFEWYYVAGHSGIPGNERVDALSASSADQIEPECFIGRREDFFHGDFETLLPNEQFDPNRQSQSPKEIDGPVYYLSLIGGEVFRDATWGECQARVKGRSGVKFKKVKSSAEEDAVLRAWGHPSKKSS